MRQLQRLYKDGEYVSFIFSNIVETNTRRLMNYTSSIFLLCFFILFSCKSSESNSNQQNLESPPLEGSWILNSLPEQEKAMQDLFPERMPTMEFDTAQKQVSGYAGCNQYFGGYTQEGASLKFSEAIGATRMFCEKSMDGEMVFLESLQKIDGYQFTEDNSLTLKSGDSDVMILKRE